MQHVAMEQFGVMDLAMPRHIDRVLTRGLRVQRGVQWPTEHDDVSGLDGLAFRHSDHNGVTAAWLTPLVEGRDRASAAIQIFNGELTAHVAADSDEHIDHIITGLARAFPRTSVDEDVPRVPVSFWTLGQHGPQSRTRRLDVTPWEDAQGNYVGDTREGLVRLMGQDFEPGVGGQLLVWHGPPGTGKTSALRSLSWEWRDWCSIHYITDPETFFGDRAAYMLDVLLHDEDEDYGAPLRSVAGSIGSLAEPLTVLHDEPEPRDRWRLLVLEDAGELLARDAKDRTGQGLSRLLNVVDGLIGQGLRVLVLITTNEPLRNLNDAVSRPGRCASEIEFTEFGRDDARVWLLDHDADLAPDIDHVEARMSLADLYARLAGWENERESAPVGFVR